MRSDSSERVKDALRKISGYGLLVLFIGIIGFSIIKSNQKSNLREAAEEAYDSSSFKTALAHYNQLIDDDPDDYYLHYKRANTFAKIGEFSAAIKDINFLILNFDDKLGYEQYEFYTWRSECFSNLYDYPNAIKSMDTAILLKEDEPDNYIKRAQIKRKISDYSGVILDLSFCIQLEPRDLYNYRMRSQAKLAISDYKGAIDDLKQAQSIDTNDLNTLCDIAEIYSIIGEYDSALVTIERALSKYPLAYELHEDKSDVLYYMERYQEALLATDGAIKINPKDASLYYSRGLILYRLKQKEEAKDYLLKAFHLGYYSAKEEL